MKAAIYRCDNDHLRIYTQEEASFKAEECYAHTVFGLPRKIGKCPVLGCNFGAGGAMIPSACNAELRLFGTIEVESPL